MLPFYRAWLSIRRLEVPSIAAVNGAAIGAGIAPTELDAILGANSAALGAR